MRLSFRLVFRMNTGWCLVRFAMRSVAFLSLKAKRNHVNRFEHFRINSLRFFLLDFYQMLLLYRLFKNGSFIQWFFLMGEVDLVGWSFLSKRILSFEKAFLKRKFLFIDDVLGLEYFITKYFLIDFYSKTFYSSF